MERGKIAWILVRVCVQLAVAAIVLHKLRVLRAFSDRPQETHVYYTNDPDETTRGGQAYTCGCSLPASLQEKKGHDLDTKNVSLNICHESSSLETVTVLMYSDSAAKLVPELEPKIKELVSYNITNRTVEGWQGGYRVNQEAHDLKGNITQVPSGIRDLFVNGRREREIYPSVGYLQSAEFMTFPRSYLRLTLTFHCRNCSSCSLDVINDMAKNVVINGSIKDAAWANCFYWGQGNNCASNNSFEARCLLYPTEVLPPTFAIQRFFETFTNTSLEVDIVRTKYAEELNPDQYDRRYNWTTLQPSSLYLNVSKVESNTYPIQYGFLEVLKGSALWASLLNMFPKLGDCSAMPNVPVCNGTSVCNVFTNANAYNLRCHDMERAQCEDLMGVSENNSSSTFDNAENLGAIGSNVSWLELECPEFKCIEAPPYTLIWNTSEKMQNDSLNRFLSSRILNDYWGKLSGVCTNTYENVLRYPLATAAASGPQVRPELNDSHPMFLQSNCTNSGYCWLTGNYHNINDTPREEWRKMPDHLFPVPDRRFVCYRLEEKDFWSWFITTAGVLFGWLGTVDLLLKWFGTPIVRKFHDKFIKANKNERSEGRKKRKLLEESCTPVGSYDTLNQCSTP